jgi:tetratricopeptide (TPR) repeat protein
MKLFSRSGRMKPLPPLSIALVGVPIVSALLLLTRANGFEALSAVQQQVLNPLEEPYRYAFQDSLKGDRSPKSSIERELAFYQRRVQEFPTSALDHATLASTYLRLGRSLGQPNWYLLADQSAQRSLSLLPQQNGEALSVLARVAEAKHDFGSALELAKQMPKKEETVAIQTTAYLAMGQLDRAQQAVDQLVDLTLSPNAFTLKAVVEMAQGDSAAALRNFEYALEVEEANDFSGSARTRTLLGRYYYEQGQLDKAEALYRETLRILPDFPLALINLAQLELRQGHDRATIRQYDRLVKVTGNVPTVYDALRLRGKAQIRLAQGDMAGAEALWSEAEQGLRQSVSDQNSSAFGHRRDLARLLLERDRPEDVAEAVALMQAETTVRQDAGTLETYAWALMESGDLQQAKAVIQQAIAQNARDASLYDRAAQIEQALGNADQAARYQQQALEIDPTFNESARRAAHLGAGLGS